MAYGDDDREMYYAQRILTTYNRDRDYGSPASSYGGWDAAIGPLIGLVGEGVKAGTAIHQGNQQEQILQQQAELEAQRSSFETMLASEETKRAVKIAGILAGSLLVLGIGGGVLYYMTQD